MSSSKRDFTDFHAFPGKYNKGKDIYEFPELIKIDSMERKRSWQIFVRLVKKGPKQKGIDWDLLAEKQIPIQDKYYYVEDKYVDLPKKVVAQAWAENGIIGGKITRNSPSYFSKVVNEGKKNQRNQFQQALIYARNEYIKRKEKGSKKRGSKNIKKSTNTMYFPMLARTWKDAARFIEYPCAVQPKFDGVRCLTYYDKTKDEVITYSRTQKRFPNHEYLHEILKPFLISLYDNKLNQSIQLDGELYEHGTKLQDISGRSRRETLKKQKVVVKKGKLLKSKGGSTKSKGKLLKSKNDTSSDSDSNDDDTNNDEKNKRSVSEVNKYHLYDCFYPKELDIMFEDRFDQLRDLYSAIEETKSFKSYDYLKNNTKLTDIIKLSPLQIADDEKQVKKIFKAYTNDGYEGVIVRNLDAPYAGDPNKTSAALRSKNVVKLKQQFTDEYEVVSFTEGKKGKDKGAILWICVTTKGKRFNVTPKNITYAERYKLYKKAKKSFDDIFAGRMLTVEYEDLSKTGVPQRAKGVAFRDYE